MSEIPEDVFEAAAQVCRECGYASRNFNYERSTACVAIAKAIIAERERCAETVRTMKSNTGMYIDRRDAISAIASAAAPKGE